MQTAPAEAIAVGLISGFPSSEGVNQRERTKIRQEGQSRLCPSPGRLPIAIEPGGGCGYTLPPVSKWDAAVTRPSWPWLASISHTGWKPMPPCRGRAIVAMVLFRFARAGIPCHWPCWCGSHDDPCRHPVCSFRYRIGIASSFLPGSSCGDCEITACRKSLKIDFRKSP